MLPVWADDSKETIDPFVLQQDSTVMEDFGDSVFLFGPGLYDNNPKPYSVYTGNNFSKLLQGGVQMNQNSSKTTAKEKDLVYKPKNKKAPKLYVGNLPAGSLTRSISGGYSLYNNDKFGIRNEYLKNSYKEEFTRNRVIVSPELYLSKNLTLRSFYDQIVERKRYEQGLAVEYSLNNSKLRSKKIKNLRFEVNASTVTDGKSDISKRVGFTTRYNF
ncbi:MAG: hypothetical protein WCF95_03265 [bacterium]